MTAFSVLKQTFNGVAERFIDRATGIGLIAVTLLISSWFFFHSFVFSPFSVETTKDVRDIILGGVQATSVYNTATMTVDENVSIQKVAKLLRVPVGKTTLIYAASGHVNAGLNIQDIEVDTLDAAERAVSITLPAPYITSVDIDIDKSDTLANYRDWFGPKAGAALYEEAQKDAIQKMRASACSGEILKAAENNATNQIQELLTKFGFRHVEIHVVHDGQHGCSVE